MSIPADPVQRLLCLHCGAESESGPEQPQAACPACGDTEHIPADLDDTVNLTITRHELRVLTMWADNWARMHGESCHPAMRTILDRIGTQTDTPLTMGQEIADLRAHFGNDNVRVIRDDGTEVDDP